MGAGAVSVEPTLDGRKIEIIEPHRFDAELKQYAMNLNKRLYKTPRSTVIEQNRLADSAG